jgi:hypothetical protein
MVSVNKQKIYYNEQLMPGITMPNFVKNGLISGNKLRTSPFQDRKDYLGEKYYSDHMSFFNRIYFLMVL